MTSPFRLKIGLVYPQTEYGDDPLAIRDYAQTAESLGFTHILAYDHILGANPERPGGWQGTYTHRHPFHEPLVLFSYMAAFTQTLEFTTGVIILPQRQTAVFARQAATLDVLSGGRLRLGIGLGWNAVEYTALNEDFHTRGKRIEEQVLVLRLLWTQPLVSFKGRWHDIPDAGLNPLPLQRLIPLWFGGNAEPVLQRCARLGDGWMPMYRSAADALPSLEKLARYREEAGRSQASFGIEARFAYGSGDPGAWLATLADWQAAGTTHISFNTMGHGFDTPAKHLAAVRLLAEVAGLG
jgi:probable F420-dependent oxidoreductase